MTARSLASRSVPLITATALSVSLYTIHTHVRPILLDASPVESTFGLPKKGKTTVVPSSSPYIPLGWGSNRYLTLVSDKSMSQLKKPSPLTQFGATPLRDLVLAEKYGAAVDARGDCWMWGTGYDESGEMGRSIKGKNLQTLIPAAFKLFCLSKSGHLYAVSASRAAQSSSKQYKNEQSWWSSLFGTDAGADFFELQAEGGLKSGERWASVSAGLHHLLAVTTKGRTFSLPIDPLANSHRQLGTRQVIDTTTSLLPASSSAGPTSLPDPASDPRAYPTLTEIPALSSVPIAAVTASALSSFARTPTGRVLGWGANESGQIGLGPSGAIEIVSTPVEIVLARNYPGGTSMKCTNVVAAGGLTMFVVERDVPGKKGTWVDLLACGNGMSGGLGNGLWSSACTSPVKVKTVSGLQEFSEKQNAFVPLGVHALSISQGPMSHIFAVLDTVGEAEAKGVKLGLYGKDVMVWGGNADYQLGNGKRSSLAVPQHIPQLISRSDADIAATREAGLSSGTLSPMPHSRLQLHQTQADAYDLDGKLIKRGVKCEETMVAGWNASVLYNKIIE